MKKTSTSGAPLLLLWTCGASLRLTVWALPPVIAIIQQDLHLSGAEVGRISARLSDRTWTSGAHRRGSALNLGQIPTSLLLLLAADKVQGRRWPYLLFGPLLMASAVGIMSSVSCWTIFWAALLGATCGVALPLGLALAPLLRHYPDDIARTSAAGFAISFGFAMLISFLSGAMWDLVGKVDAALIPILLGTLPISIFAPTLALRRN